MTQTADAFRLGVDIGGTFTDAILISEDGRDGSGAGRC